MSPRPLQLPMLSAHSSTKPTDEINMQWSHPGDVFSLLLLVGGDVVQRAIAPLVGFQLFKEFPLAPVCFSFGWVAYAFTMIATAAGKLQLMPPPDCTAQVINADNGIARDNCSWVLGRLIRDKESRVGEFDRSGIEQKPPKDSTGEVSLMIDIFESHAACKPQPSTVWITSIFTIVIQWVIAAIPLIMHKNYIIFIVTVLGSVLAMVSAGLPQWKAEKWSAAKIRAPKDGNVKTKPVILTRGNGHQYAMLIICNKEAWDLETMATARPVYCQGTRWYLWSLSVAWIALLFTTLGIKQDTWPLVAVGIIGMIQNTIVGAYPCKPEELGIVLKPHKDYPSIIGYQRTTESKKLYLTRPLDKKNDMKQCDDPTTQARDVMGAIMELALRMPRAGKALLPIFFPGDQEAFPESQKEFWRRINDRVSSEGDEA